eukprot:31185-Pelagococcus_subviridis.AAC.9
MTPRDVRYRDLPPPAAQDALHDAPSSAPLAPVVQLIERDDRAPQLRRDVMQVHAEVCLGLLQASERLLHHALRGPVHVAGPRRATWGGARGVGGTEARVAARQRVTRRVGARREECRAKTSRRTSRLMTRRLGVGVVVQWPFDPCAR